MVLALQDFTCSQTITTGNRKLTRRYDLYLVTYNSPCYSPDARVSEPA